MNYTNLLDSLRQASLFDVYRLGVAIDHELDNPRHVREIKKKVKGGHGT